MCKTFLILVSASPDAKAAADFPTCEGVLLKHSIVDFRKFIPFVSMPAPFSAAFEPAIETATVVVLSPSSCQAFRASLSVLAFIALYPLFSSPIPPPTTPAATITGAIAPPVAAIKSPLPAIPRAPIAKFLGDLNIIVTGDTIPFPKFTSFSLPEIFPSSVAHLSCLFDGTKLSVFNT